MSRAAHVAIVLPERESVLHSWCVQSEWDAPTIVGGEGARLHTDDGRSILDMRAPFTSSCRRELEATARSLT